MKIDFEFSHPVYGIFRDALNLPDDHRLSDEEIESAKQQRFDRWVAHIETPPVEQPVAEETPPIEQPVAEQPLVGE